MQRKMSDSILQGDWRENCVGICNRLGDMLLEKSFLWDVAFRVETRVFKAHRLILSIGSSVFEDMFYTHGEQEQYMITVSNVDAAGFQNLLRYIYTGHLTFKDIQEALSTCEAGEKYDVPELKALSESFLAEQNYKPAILWPVLENAELLDMPVIKKKCLQFVRENTREVLKTEGFLSSSFRVVKTILGLNELSAPEIELLDFLARWAKRKTAPNSSSTRPVFSALVPHIRFKAIRPEELSSFLEKHPECLEEKDSRRILKHLVEPDSNPLPEWCDKRPPRRNSIEQRPKLTFAQKLWRTLKDPQLF